MARWFRLYDSVIDDPKVQRLPDAAFRAWVNLMCVASKNGGMIPDSLDDLAFSLRVTKGKVRDLLQILQSAGLIERGEIGYEPHNWRTRQYDSDSAAERMRRYRARNKERNETQESVTPLRNGDGAEKTEQNRTDDDERERAKNLLNRICEILRIRLQDDPSRITWQRQVEEMLRDGIPEPDILRGAEVARTGAVINMKYIRAVAMSPPKPPSTASPADKPTRDEIGEKLKAKWAKEEAESEQTGRIRAGA